MAYDRYDTRDAPRDERSRWSDDRSGNRDRGGRGERGFFDRAGDEVASWFGDEDAARRRRQDRMSDHRDSGWSSRDHDQRERMGSRDDYNRDRGFGRDRDQDRNRDWFETRGANERGGWSERDYNPSWRSEMGGRERDREHGFERDRSFGRQHQDRDYRPITGDYGRSSERGFEQGRGEDRQSEWSRDPYRSTSRAGTSDWSDRSRHEDRHYDSWRQRHMSELDRDYDDYRREHQSKFESDFAGWREKRQQKRGLMAQVREHMEVVGSDDQHVGTVDTVAGDRLILTKSDPESGGVHHSLGCSDIDRIDADRIVLDCSADEARQRWHEERGNRALFERDDQGGDSPHALDRSFSGTYR